MPKLQDGPAQNQSKLGPDDVNPKTYASDTNELVKQRETHLLPVTKRLLQQIGSSRVFFYPACSMDWQPLHRFTHLCDTFVYCDYNAQDTEFGDFKKIIYDGVDHGVGLEVGEVSNLHTDTVNELAKPDEQPKDFLNIDGAWGKAIELTRHIGDHKRKILLLYFRAEGVTLYRNLFNKRFIAPRMICLKFCEHGFGGQNWTTFKKWNGPLGRAVWENRERPEFIVSEYTPPDYDWPWNRVWQQHRNWRTTVDWTLTSFVLPTALPAPGGAIPRFDVNMPDRTIIKIKPPPYVRTNVPNAEPMMSLQREQEVQTLEMALRNLRGNCAQPQIKIDHVHSLGCHFEDEAPALSAWKWRATGKTTAPKTLTIHCETEGDLVSYGPAADEIL